MSERWLNEGEEAGCRLLLRVDGPLDPAALAEGRLAGVVASGDTLQAIVEPAHAAGKAVFGAGDGMLAAKAGADGVLLDDPGKIEEARRALGADALIGAHCGLSRHAAIVAGEAGADYVVFAADGDDDALVETVAWWAELSVLPSVAVLAGGGPAYALALAGVDFLLVDDARQLARLDGLLPPLPQGS